ncbi:replication protein A 70 kDa DNA-binding subunit B [Tanacetum coccineum]
MSAMKHKTDIMFKIIFRIFDESGSAQVVIFDNNMYKMTKLFAWEIMEKQGMDVDQYFPGDLNQIIGKQYLFKVKYTEFNHNNNNHVYRAKNVTEDVETINYFNNGFFEDEDEDNTSEANEMNEVLYIVFLNTVNNHVSKDEDYTSEVNENEINADADDEFTSPSIEDNEDAIDYFTTPSIEINELTSICMTSYDKTTSNGQAFESEKNSEIVIIDLSDYETEDEEEDCNLTKKLVTVKMEKDP